MKHYIIFKFSDKSYVTDSNFSDIENMFSTLTAVNGIRYVTVSRNCIDRDNRFDGMIMIDMDREMLEVYDNSAEHKLWKKKYGPLIEKKAIFDCE